MAADWLFAKFWKKYPDLRMALSEGGIGWMPYLLERADFTYEHHHEWTFSDFGGERPSEWPNCPEFLWASINRFDPKTIDAVTHTTVMREYSYDSFTRLGGKQNCTVGALRYLGRDVEVSPRLNLGGLRADSMDYVGNARRPVTSGEIQRMFASA